MRTARLASDFLACSACVVLAGSARFAGAIGLAAAAGFGRAALAGCGVGFGPSRISRACRSRSSSSKPASASDVSDSGGAGAGSGARASALSSAVSDFACGATGIDSASPRWGVERGVRPAGTLSAVGSDAAASGATLDACASSKCDADAELDPGSANCRASESAARTPSGSDERRAGPGTFVTRESAAGDIGSTGSRGTGGAAGDGSGGADAGGALRIDCLASRDADAGSDLIAAASLLSRRAKADASANDGGAAAEIGSAGRGSGAAAAAPNDAGSSGRSARGSGAEDLGGWATRDSPSRANARRRSSSPHCGHRNVWCS